MNQKSWIILAALLASTAKAEEPTALEFKPDVVKTIGAVTIVVGNQTKSIRYTVIDPEEAFLDRSQFARTSTVEDSSVYSLGTQRLYDVGYNSSRNRVKFDAPVIKTLIRYDTLLQSSAELARFIWEHNHTTKSEDECHNSKKLGNDKLDNIYCSELGKVYLGLPSNKQTDIIGDMRFFLNFEAAQENLPEARTILEYQVKNPYGYIQVKFRDIKPEEVETLSEIYDQFIDTYFNKVTKPLSRRNASRYFARKAEELRQKTDGKIILKHFWYE
ncbi:MAG TPA: hypothetical protein VJI98_06670 [Candidatus Nanoarchaeia archaeon]|nr:hypothetical protein [Candidatus Nanoarchaeia archaeon]